MKNTFIIFDMDGTLADTMTVYRDAFVQTLNNLPEYSHLSYDDMDKETSKLYIEYGCAVTGSAKIFDKDIEIFILSVFFALPLDNH